MSPDLSATSPWRRGLIAAGVVCLALLFVPSGQSHAYDLDTPSIITKNPTVGRLYLVQDGDTLWDLADLFMYDPYYWPRLWSFNPQVTNPHYIYPGDLLQLTPPAGVGGPATIVWSDSRYSRRKVDLEIFSRYVGYLPDRLFRESGEIKFAREGHNTLAEYDEIYIEFSEETSVKVGDRFTIYRYDGEIEHPDDDWENADGDDVVGHRIRHLGIAKVLDADKKYMKALIVEAYEEITRGDLLTPIFPHSWMVRPTRNEVEVVAHIVDYHDPMRYAGQFMYVYVDKGRNDGLERGNRFIIQRRGDGLWYEDPEEDLVEDFPWEHLGEVMVVEAFETTSLGIVTRTMIELMRGERLYMQPGY